MARSSRVSACRLRTVSSSDSGAAVPVCAWTGNATTNINIRIENLCRPPTSHLQQDRERQLEYGSSGFRILKTDVSTVILKNLLTDNQSETNAVLLSIADKWLKQFLSYRL